MNNISANADEPRDVASRKIDHIALPTECTITNKRASVDSNLANCYPVREMTSVIVISTYLNDNAQPHLVDLLLIYYTIKFATNTMSVCM